MVEKIEIFSTDNFGLICSIYNSNMTKQEIKKELEKSFNNLQTWFKNQNDELFIVGPDKRWNASQQLDHLHKTTKVINKGMSVNKLILWWKFGTRKKDQLSFDELASLYKSKINDLPEDFKQPLPPKSYGIEMKHERLQKYADLEATMYVLIDKWSDKDLDKYVLPHPVMGNFSIREWLMFNAIHNNHHRDILKNDYES